MKKLIAVMMVTVLLSGCGKKSEVDYSAEQGIEYSYSELKEMRDIFVDEWVQKTSKLSEAEYYGTSNDEEESNDHYFDVAADYAKKVAENHKDIPVGEKVILIGYIDNIMQLDQNGFFVRKGAGDIVFSLKHNASDNEYDGFSCRTNDKDFLELKDNTAIKIEAVFLETDMYGSNSDLYDCKILEIGETKDVETEALMTTASQ